MVVIETLRINQRRATFPVLRENFFSVPAPDILAKLGKLGPRPRQRNDIFGRDSHTASFYCSINNVRNYVKDSSKLHLRVKVKVSSVFVPDLRNLHISCYLTLGLIKTGID